MTKRIIALILCLILCVSALAACGGKIDQQSEYKGQQAIMYLTENIYNLDPAYAYTNDATRSVVSMIFETLFTLNDNGKVQNALAESYKTEEKEEDGVTSYYMYITIKENASWSDNVPVTADDVVYAWKRLLNPNNSFEAASLLFDIKNARAYNQADVSKDDIGLFADGKLLTIQFEGKIDYDQFILNLTSLALAPLREDIASKNADWSKKPSVSAYSGPFKLTRTSFSVNGNNVYEDFNYSVKMVDENNKVIKDKNGNDMYTAATKIGKFKEQILNSFVLERNMYYYRTNDKDEKLDKSVTPYRILVDCSLSAEDIKAGYEAGAILYVGDIPMSLRNEYKDQAIVEDSLSTTALYFNQNADIATVVLDGEGNPVTEKLFANEKVRQALSLAIDRKAIAEALVFAEAANGLVPTGCFDASDVKKTFRDSVDTSFELLDKDSGKVWDLITESGINPASYSFTISVASYDEDLVYIAEQVCKAWQNFGFDVSVKKIGTIANNDFHKDVNSIPSDLCDDLYDEAFRRGDFDVAVVDIVAPSVDPFSVLAPFAQGFSGQAIDMSNSESYELSPHITGYNNPEYNELIEKIFAEKNVDNRTADLHRAEEILMNDMPVCPIVFNKSAYLINEDTMNIRNQDKNNNYYQTVSFRKMSMSDKKYDEYTVTCAKFIAENYDAWRTNPLSYFGSDVYKNSSLAEFADEASNYSYLFKNKDYDFIPELTTGTEEQETEAKTQKPTEAPTTEATTEAPTETTSGGTGNETNTEATPAQ